MSRAGTSTDNPVIESKNGWINGLPLNEKWYDTEKEYLNDYQKFLKKNKS